MEFLTQQKPYSYHHIHQEQQPIRVVDDNIGADAGGFMEMEHLFGKVATPSDVGKLNRLVIPKQYAEKYFPLDSPTKKKGILLSFEDPKGKSWRFRYSYWTSSQSYVMTKGWSRFVKENKLHPGDLISFGRAVRESGKYGGRLYIDYRRSNLTSISHFQIPKINSASYVQNDWGAAGEFGSILDKYKRSSAAVSQHDQNMPLIVDSMHGSVVRRENISAGAPHHFRLFGVDVEYSIPRESTCHTPRS